jgi:hypothetical protein
MTDIDETLPALTEDEYKDKLMLMMVEDSTYLVPHILKLMDHIKGHDKNKYEEYYKKITTILNETHRELHDVLTPLIEDAAAVLEHQ